MKQVFPAVDVRTGKLDPGTVHDLVINATPLGMKADDPLPFEPASLAPSTLVVDVITKPVMTPLLERARRLGLRTHSGNHMHAGQAVEAARFFSLTI